MRTAENPRVRFSLAPLLLPLLLAARQTCAGPHSQNVSHWSYRDISEWESMFPDCKGHMQSPINIDTAAARFSPQLEPLLLTGYNLPPGAMLPLQNNGHTLRIGLPKKMTLRGGGLSEPYLAVELHLHWGSEDIRPGSEHTVDGYRYPGELHVVHYSSRFDSFQEAESEPGGLAVLAAFLQVGPETNEPYEHILKHLEEIKEEGDETMVAGFDVTKLLPTNLDRYFHYDGSLTTPPCYQTVNWTILNQTIQLSKEQIWVLEDTLHGDDYELIQSNFRQPQGLYGRSILSSFQSLERALPPGVPASPSGPDPPASSEGGGQPAIGAGEKSAKQTGNSLGTGDILAILFGILFCVTALAFLFYVRNHRSHTHRLSGQATKATAIYTPATTEENMN